MASKTFLLTLLLVTLVAVITVDQAVADVHIGSCRERWDDCNNECKGRGFKGGHCGSFLNWNCWCEQ